MRGIFFAGVMMNEKPHLSMYSYSRGSHRTSVEGLYNATQNPGLHVRVSRGKMSPQYWAN